LIKFQPAHIEGSFILQPKMIKDERGVFSRLFCQETLAIAGCDFQIVQINNSETSRAGTIRGLHYQTGSFAEQKLVRCVNGSVYDVMADTRRESSTYGQWFGTILSAKERNMLLIPEGVAHGFLSLENSAEIIYASTAEYSPTDEQGLRWDDPFFDIDWPFNDSFVLSDKDRQWPDFHVGQ